MHKISVFTSSVSLRLGGLLFLLCVGSQAQRVAVVVPETDELTERFASSISESIGAKIKVLDHSMSEAAYQSLAIETPFNMTVGDSRRAASAVGCDFLLLVKAGSMRRSSLLRGDYYESFVAAYLVSERTGRLVDWSLTSFDADSAEKAERMLFDSVRPLAERIAERAKGAKLAELNEKAPLAIEQLPLENSQEGRDFRPPVPYKRIKPAYTPTAFLYSVRATVEVEADIEADGRVSRTEIARWAGYGLDESVIDAVRKMNWRPAERAGKPLRMRVLLRYNFTKIEREQE